jgi:type IV conjugative transfer system protein TraE
MDKYNFDEKINTVMRNHLLFKRLVFIEIIAIIILLLMLWFNINKKIVVLVPQVAPEYKLWVGQSQVSNEYLTTLSRNVLDLMLNITPYNVDAQHQEMLNIVSSEYQAHLKSKLSNIAKIIHENNISQNFYIEKISIIHNKNIAYINGNLNEYIDKTFSAVSNQTYKLTFKVSNYGVKLMNFELIDDKDQQLKGIGL